MLSKKIFFFAIILASVFIINNFIHSIYSLWQKNYLITKARQELEKEKKENNQLKSKLTEVNKPGFMEKEIRDRLFLAKPGEGIVVLPTDYSKATNSGEKQQDMEPNWKKWWDMFFTKAR